MTADWNPDNTYTIDPFDISKLNLVFIQNLCSALIIPETRGYLDLPVQHIETGAASFGDDANIVNPFIVRVQENEESLQIACDCPAPKNKLCEHQAQALYNICYRDELRIFFDKKLRAEKLKQFAAAYGMDEEMEAEDFFGVTYVNRKAVIKARNPELLPITKETTRALQEQLLPKEQAPPYYKNIAGNTELVVIFRQHKFYKHLCIELYESATTQNGKLKNPLNPVDAQDYLWTAAQHKEVKFFAGITRYQNNAVAADKTSLDIAALKSVLQNPRGLRFFNHNAAVSENIVAGSVTEMIPGNVLTDLGISVNHKGNFYEITAHIRINNQEHSLHELEFRYDFFVLLENMLHLVGNAHFFKIIAFFRQNNFRVLIHKNKFTEFRQSILEKLGDTVQIRYEHFKPATKKQIAESNLDKPFEQLIYLSDSDNYIRITPVMRYGDVEIPVLTKRQIFTSDSEGNLFTVQRNEEAEINFTALLLKQYADFYDQAENDLSYFYIHRQVFLDESWFLNAFEAWRAAGIVIYGFNQLKENKLNAHKANISIHVLSGANWFNTNINVGFGKQKATLKQLAKSVRNKTKFVQLDDGTLGILPAEWIERFARFFDAGEILEDALVTPKINFAAMAELYEPYELDEEVARELQSYQSRFAKFDTITEIEVPETLNATLRHYQWQGLNWLNFLDDYNFGGCLADDMGLGKSIQVIAFILSQRKKVTQNTNLIVVPTSLIFNWQEELAKFAPSVKVHVVHGAGRKKSIATFGDFEVILVSYSTMVSDIELLQKYTFNYIFLDESQNIKNPESQRYQAARQLKSRNKIVITGTPVENNTMDLYGQLSFACPGLLGKKQYFKDVYSIPIDRFKDSRRARELQHKINPFILRRTKQQVATELPDKTEMVLYCPMGEEQRKAYDVCEKEFRDFIHNKDSEEISKNSMHVLRGITKLRQICNSPLLLGDDKLYADASSKIEALMEHIEEKSGEHKILIFSQFVSMLNLIKKELETRAIRFQYLTGATRKRAEAVNEFRNDDSVRVFLVSLKAGGTGLNLTEADYVYLIDPWWNPAVENQAIDRSYRIGQKKNVVAIRLICPGTIEEKMMKLQQHKKELAGDLIRTDNAILKSLTKNDLLSLLGE